MDGSLFEELPEHIGRERILNEILGRLRGGVSCKYQGQLLRLMMDNIPGKKIRPSDPVLYRTEYRIGLPLEFLDGTRYLDDYLKVALKGRDDPAVPLVKSCDEFFKISKIFGEEILTYCENIELKIFMELQIKNADQVSNHDLDTFANYQALTIYIVEAQLSISDSGLTTQHHPKIEDEERASLHVNHGTSRAWSGALWDERYIRDLVDRFILDETKALKFKNDIYEIEKRAIELNSEVQKVLHRIEESSVISLREEPLRESPAGNRTVKFMYNEPSGLLRGNGSVYKFKQSTSKRFFESFVMHRKRSVDDLMKLLDGEKHGDRDPRKTVYNVMGHLNDVLKKSGMNLSFLQNDRGYEISEPVQLDLE